MAHNGAPAFGWARDAQASAKALVAFYRRLDDSKQVARTHSAIRPAEAWLKRAETSKEDFRMAFLEDTGDGLDAEVVLWATLGASLGALGLINAVALDAGLTAERVAAKQVARDSLRGLRDVAAGVRCAFPDDLARGILALAATDARRRVEDALGPLEVPVILGVPREPLAETLTACLADLFPGVPVADSAQASSALGAERVG
jgi:hypothetical protein